MRRALFSLSCGRLRWVGVGLVLLALSATPGRSQFYRRPHAQVVAQQLWWHEQTLLRLQLQQMRHEMATDAVPVEAVDTGRIGVLLSRIEVREIVDQRADAKAAYQRVMDLVSTKRPNVRIFDEDGQTVSVDKLRRLAGEESARAAAKAEVRGSGVRH